MFVSGQILSWSRFCDRGQNTSYPMEGRKPRFSLQFSLQQNGRSSVRRRPAGACCGRMRASISSRSSIRVDDEVFLNDINDGAMQSTIHPDQVGYRGLQGTVRQALTPFHLSPQIHLHMRCHSRRETLSPARWHAVVWHAMLHA